ncbi:MULTISPECIES: glucuronate isomerase [Clostridium]|uniref:glucuronate isomerase n=1 Tax=Clostridium TaxID=1485 RepID=UPI00189A0397|nr:MULTISPECIES: glucuronate isomerase [Clostridium]MDI9218083.1 glucuronate isomerase [Clostridium tertium]
MDQFMNEDFLLNSDVAKKLYHNYIEDMPIVDYHCHLDSKEIAEDKRFQNITELWLGGDHYKWRLMRANGVEEKYITGNASDREKFQKWAETLEKAIGNPLYHWSHLELKRYFDYDGCLNKETAEEVWTLCNKKLQESSMSVKSIIKNSNVRIICTTDDPIDSLIWHKRILEDEGFGVQVIPAWRPDKAMDIEKDDYLDYIDKLSNVTKIAIKSFDDLKVALKKQMEYFNSMGCKTSDHGLSYVMFKKVDYKTAENIFQRRLSGEKISKEEQHQFKTAFLLFSGKEYHKLNWVMQLHFGVRRDNNEISYKNLGPNTGFDCIDNVFPADELIKFLDALNCVNELPKTILYSLNPNDNAIIDSLAGCFQEEGIKSKVQHGAAWWFNDHKIGIEQQMISLANFGLLANFVGMLTDSRSFLSYTRHEYFRRILCNLLGDWVVKGEYPNDINRIANIAKDISYRNAIEYFNFKLENK